MPPVLALYEPFSVPLGPVTELIARLKTLRYRTPAGDNALGARSAVRLWGERPPAGPTDRS